MKTIIPHGIVKRTALLPLISSEYDVTHRADVAIVSKEIEVPDDISRESVDAITADLRKVFARLEGINFVENPHILVRESARARINGNGKPSGYVVEMSVQGPTVYAIEHMDKLPMLAGYGSLMDPLQLATNTVGGDLRNTLDNDVRRKIVEDN